MACIDCFNNCGDRITSDKCVKYTGEDIPLLGICQGDSLYEFEQIIIEKLTEQVDASDITLEELTIECDFITDILAGKDKTLANIIQVLVDSQCSLKELIDTIPTEEQYAFNTPCLTLKENPTKDDILQASINLLCSLSGRLTAIESNYVRATDLPTLIAQYLANQNTTNIQQFTKLIPNTAYPYFGSMSVFDTTGKGLLSAGFDKIYFCNGSNGTPDLRGRTAVGANVNVGGNLDNSVNPTINNLYQISVNTKIGKFDHPLVSNENAPHTHVVNDPGHTHYSLANSISYNQSNVVSSTNFPARGLNDGGDGSYVMQGSSIAPSVGKTSSSVTGISIASSGAGNAHNNVQPSLGCNWIIYLG